MTDFILVLFFVCGIAGSEKQVVSDLFDSLFPPSYSKHHAPSTISDKQGLTTVVCGMTAITIIRLSPKEMDMKIEMAFYIGWKDERLNMTALKNSTAAYTVFPMEIANKLWYPTLSFGNCKDCSSSTLYKPSKDTLFYNHRRFELYSWVRRVETFVCNFNMKNYPFDKHVCSVAVKAFKTQPIAMNYTIWQPNISLINVPPGIDLYSLSVSNCSFDDDTHSSCGYFDIGVERLSSRPMLLIFYPSVLIVVLSWISFWLDPTGAAPRVTLGLTSMLTLFTHFSTAQRELPAVSTTMALDEWMFFCLFVVFASLIEFSLVSIALRSSTSHVEPVNLVHPVTKDESGENVDKSGCCFGGNAKRIDRIARIVFPLFFIAFNLYFWTKYSS